MKIVNHLTHVRSESTTITKNPVTVKPTGYAFVDIATHTDARRAVADLNDKTFQGRKISVQFARSVDSQASSGKGKRRGRKRKLDESLDGGGV